MSSSWRQPPALIGLSSLVSVLGLGGCDPAVVIPDAGPDAPMMRDAGPPPPPYSCGGDSTVVMGVLNTPETLTFDTTMTDERPRDLGLRCGNAGGEIRWARQEVVEYHVPGTGPVSVNFTSVGGGTFADFDTLIQVREDCETVPETFFPPTCFNDSTTTEVRASGAYQTTGGSTLYFILTGYSEPPALTGRVDEGIMEVTFTPRANTPPTIVSASARTAGDAMILNARATDAEGPILGFGLQLFTAGGQIDFDLDGDADDQDVIVFGWEMVSGSNPYDATSTITPDADRYRLADYCRAVGCTDAAIAVFDRQYANSEFLRFGINEMVFVAGLGDICDAFNVCADGLVCAVGRCAVIPSVMTACAAAAPLVLATPIAGMPTTATVTGTLSRGAGTISSPCSSGSDPVMDSLGREAIYRLEITTPGSYNLELTTEGAMTGGGNTLLYVRRADCWDGRPAASVACNDDITPGTNLASRVSVPVTNGVYYVFVEFFGSAPSSMAPFELNATLSVP